MKAKTLLLPILIFSLFCGCAEKTAPTVPTEPSFPAVVIETEETQTEPVTEAPEPPFASSTTVLWIDGVRYPACYQTDDEKLVRLSDLAEQSGATGEAEGLLIWNNELAVDDAGVFVNGERIDCTCFAWDGDYYLSTGSLLPALGLTELQDLSWNQRIYTRIITNDGLLPGYEIPILMYHAVSDQIWGIEELFVSPSSMEKQLQALLEAGCTPITFEDLDRIDEIEKPVMLTFDDGYRDNYTELFPLLQQYQVKVTIFLITDVIGYEKNLTQEQIREMADSGLVSFQSHTKTHGHLDEMSREQLETEMRESMMAVARYTGKQPFVICYPEGRANSLAKEVAGEYYEFGLYMGGSKYVTGGAPFDIYRQYVARDTSLSRFLYYVN